MGVQTEPPNSHMPDAKHVMLTDNCGDQVHIEIIHGNEVYIRVHNGVDYTDGHLEEEASQRLLKFLMENL